MFEPKVFVSHSHSDDAFAERFVADLRAAGANAWLDKTDLGAGNFQQRISAALGACEWFTLVLTRDALASEWVRQEVDAANRLKNLGLIRGLLFIQAGILDVREMPALWGVYNVFDATQGYTRALTRALDALGLVTFAQAQPSVPPITPPPSLHYSPVTPTPTFDERQSSPAHPSVTPASSERRVLIADQLANERKDAEALAEYERAIKQNPWDAAALMGKALMLRRLGRSEDAGKAFTAATIAMARTQRVNG